MTKVHRSELRQLLAIYEDLKESYRGEVAHGDLEEAHHILVERLRPLREMLLREEWHVDQRAIAESW